MSRNERNIHSDPEKMAPHDQLVDLSKTGELPDGQDLAGLEREIETEIARNSEPLQDVKHSDSDFVGKDQSSKSSSDQARPLPFVDETVAEEEEE